MKNTSFSLQVKPLRKLKCHDSNNAACNNLAPRNPMMEGSAYVRLQQSSKSDGKLSLSLQEKTEKQTPKKYIWPIATAVM